MENAGQLPRPNEHFENSVPRMLKEKQAAVLLAVSVAALRKWRREGRGPQFTHLERCVRYPLCAIERFIEENSTENKKAADLRSAAKGKMRDEYATTQI